MRLWSLAIVCLALFQARLGGINATSLESVDDSDLVHLLTGQDNVIALFTKDNCPECEKLEAVVENLQKQFKESLNAVVVKAHNSHMVGIYNPTRELSLIFFRRGIPLLYYGEPNEEEIMMNFVENQDPVVKELNDENFEHLTQAATGATTGDWFVFFYSADCILCQRLYAVWEAVGAKLKRRLTVARVNRGDVGMSTAKRFNVLQSPEFLFIRQGKVYRYKSKEYTPKAFIQFAENGYQKHTNPEDVPALPNPMNDFLTENLKYFSDSQTVIVGGVALLAIIFLWLIVKTCKSSKPATKTEGKKTKKTK